ncbi:FAD-binding oxidoreductase [Deinococcus peraridilitoris]|uniref:D-lactate dehydrogenase (cytochrome) n=1 Tax=Deinococcus peraridilitoris (strain DSM 19664 / LMG 22246 / CIP 109416 / KR-200) TaxID=937777 RepID=L0A4D0_DEIPD|nr:FAD-binding oxidoreductase [Deinococcus peraridilitoris]AFZ68037.1 FAD/FMN-dependent dehydrogenase [Deinococcus peraridilitoris DSM 19664]
MTSRPALAHRAVARAARGDDAEPTLSRDPFDLEGVSRDAAHLIGQPQALAQPTSEAQIARLLRSGARVLPVGVQSSLTGGGTPRGDVVLSLARFDLMELGADTVRVGAGVPLQTLGAFLAGHGRAYPATPTYLGATVGGAVANNAAGAATYKYGTTRAWVEGLTVVLAGGDVLEVRRGEVRASEDGFFEIDGPGGLRRIPLPTYPLPRVPKLAAGYYAAPGMDLLDLFVGSEGTLGVVTEVELRTQPLRDTAFVLLPLPGESAALRLVALLREHSQRTWQGADPNGLDVSAIESLDGRCLALLREDGLTRFIPAQAGYALIVQLELPSAPLAEHRAALEAAFDDDAPDAPLKRFVTLLLEHDAFEDAQIALPGEPFAAEVLKIREAVPDGVNRRVREAQRQDARVSKVAGDMIVPFEHFAELMAIYRRGFEERGLDYAIYGHASDGNVHPNLLPRSGEDAESGRELLFLLAREVVRLGGSPLSEHGVGKSPVKQAMLRELFGEAGVTQMRAVKRALDPAWQLAAGNMFPES